MWPWLLAAVGLTLAAKGRTKTVVNKLAILGPRSGETWDAELFPQASMVVVHSRRGDGAVASFIKDPVTKRFTFKEGRGSSALVAMMRDDFEGDKPPTL
jgi:hypothetical protein